ncbi:hypothetical protein ACH5RR_006957 [Cinchona calisaya]|uniref:Uncharacterized protein n=1 Tax=Cinchona calisaya TaxID=153742 RepID=A0ABD3AQU0_9GENT
MQPKAIAYPSSYRNYNIDKRNHSEVHYIAAVDKGELEMYKGSQEQQRGNEKVLAKQSSQNMQVDEEVQRKQQHFGIARKEGLKNKAYYFAKRRSPQQIEGNIKDLIPPVKRNIQVGKEKDSPCKEELTVL